MSVSLSPKASVLITDLDNTLFDWVDVWHASFQAMVEEISRISDIGLDELLPEIKEVHKKHGTSEYAFLIEELQCLRKKFPDQNLLEVFAPAINAFREKRREHLKLYDGVKETLIELKKRGVLIVGYTESKAFYSNYRMRKLELDGLVDYLYSPPDHKIPNNLSRQEIRKYSEDSYEFNYTEHRYTPEHELKPSVDVLNSILVDLAVSPEECVYIGDSLMKDIAMAQGAGVLDVHAEYGKAQDREAYDLLKQVTHWTDADVAREKAILEGETVRPTVKLTASMKELLSHVNFVRFRRPVDHEKRIELMFRTWDKIVDVQKHFNDLQMKVRSFAIAVVGAFMGGAGLAIKNEVFVHLFGKEFPVSALIVGGVIPIWFVFFLMDRYWYHNFLTGAVKQGLYSEKILKPFIPNVGLTTAIGKESPSKIGGMVIHSRHKINSTYMLVGLALVAVCIGLATATPNSAIKHIDTNTTATE
ncbi:HAD hydrolase-like protein [Thalassospira sp. GO-4]|jgi:FMN phosphatase YigB (HAD superfamily)|uniref:HAD family hydrolase n=1 Tax=Thalassospira sp. GO-4 TaxID=2946605 RepID=UPI0020240C7D|nr:HAD hydrolase-like protein [Thalassospira sp. GO-4]URK19698.1 HAD hydrolase-like protein [Thalassospira sp. GO-4]